MEEDKKEEKIEFNLKRAWKKTWKFLWDDDSLLSWIVSLALAFIIVKFIFFPLLSLALGTALPLVVVESGSMHHPGSFLGNTFGLESNFNQWWNEKGSWYTDKNFIKEQVLSWDFRTGLEAGDIIVVYGRGNLEIGDIIIFEGGSQHPIIHRIISIENTDQGKIYSTKGDNNPGQLNAEKQISEEQILGHAVFKIPKLGWIKLGVVRLFS